MTRAGRHDEVVRTRQSGRLLRFPCALPVLLLGLTACSSDAPDTVAGTSSTAVATTSTAAPTPTSPTTSTSPTRTEATTAPSTVPATTDGAIASTVLAPDSPPWNFTFGALDGLVAVDSPHRFSDPLDDETITVWASAAGVTEAYLTLRDVPGGPATSPEGDVTATRIQSATGEAWLVADNVPADPPPSSATRIMWWRDDGRVWIVSNYGVTSETLTSLALSLEVEPDGSHTLADPSMTLVGTASLDTYESMTQAWTLDRHNLSLTVTNGGLAQQLSDLSATLIVEHDVAGRSGYAVTLSNGQVNLIWPTDHAGWWMSVSGEPVLADRADELAAAVTAI